MGSFAGSSKKVHPLGIIKQRLCLLLTIVESHIAKKHDRGSREDALSTVGSKGRQVGGLRLGESGAEDK